MFYSKYVTMHKVHRHAGAIRQLLYGCAYVREIIHSLKLVGYLPIHTHKLYNNLHLYCFASIYGLDNTCMIMNPGTDSHVHACSLISTLVIHFLESIINPLARLKNFNFLASLCS